VLALPCSWRRRHRTAPGDAWLACSKAARRCRFLATRTQRSIMPGGLVDLRQPGIRHGPAGGRQPPGLGDLAGRVVRLGDQPVVVLGALIQAAQRGDQVLGSAAPAAGVTAGHYMGLDVGHQLPDIRRGGLVQPAVAPVLDDPVPVRAVRPAGAVADRRRHHRHIAGECRHLRPLPRDAGQVRRGQAHPLQHEPGRVDHGLPGCARACVRSGDRHRSPPSCAGNGMSAARAWSTTASE
jgi:hypothetical protein